MELTLPQKVTAQSSKPTMATSGRLPTLSSVSLLSRLQATGILLKMLATFLKILLVVLQCLLSSYLVNNLVHLSLCVKRNRPFMLT